VIPYSDHHDASHAVLDNATSHAIIAEVPTTTCSELEQDISFQIAGATTVALFHEGVPKLAAEPAALHCSPSSTIAGKESLEVVPSACTGFITTAPAICSTNCLPQQPMGAPVLVLSSSSTLIEYGLHTKSIDVAAVPLAITELCLAVSAWVVFVPRV
jgi:hypothetical protein